jgi:hypothetical protein
VLRSGNYWNVSVILGPEDSGLTIEAEPGGTSILHGGQRLTGWGRDGDRFVAAPLPDLFVTSAEIEAGLALPEWEVRLLLIHGQSRPRARFPEEDALRHQTTFDVSWMSSTGGGWQRQPTLEELTTLRYHPGDLPRDLQARDAEVTVYHMWDESCVGVSNHAPDQGLLQLAPATGHPPGAFGVNKFVVWNIREGMTRPGQWYHDRVRNRIVYWPLPGEDIHQAEVVVPTRRTVLRLQGTPEAPVRQVTLRGLTVTATTTPLIAAGFAAAAFAGAISLSDAEDCALDALTVRGVAGHGIDAGRSCVRTRVSYSEITDCGAGGIYRGGRNSLVRHNEIHDCPYSAINYGGIDNVVEYNLLYDCMKVLHDGAAIYLFAARNCVLRGNVARDIVDTGGYGASAYYLDERSTGCVVERNLSLRVARPIHNHMATNNVIRDNVFIVEGARMIHYEASEPTTTLPDGIIVADPMFNHWRQGDFRFQPASPAHALNLQPIDAGSAGRSVRRE